MVINIIIWFLGLVFLLSNWGIKVTPIIAGLGIGGIAVALAAQNILGDLFSYFVIFFDRPFEAGDFIIVDDKMGTIEYVGIKTTHIRALGGEQIIIGNSNLTNSRIHNYKRMARRRVVFSIDVEYGTKMDTLQKVPGMLRAIVEQQEPITFDRAHFSAYKDWSLRFEVVYYVLSADFNVYMDIQQRINFAIYEKFEQHNINFAFPTQSLMVKAGLNERRRRRNESIQRASGRDESTHVVASRLLQRCQFHKGIGNHVADAHVRVFNSSIVSYPLLPRGYLRGRQAFLSFHLRARLPARCVLLPRRRPLQG